MYAVLPFGIATGLVEMPYLLLQSCIFVPIMYFCVGFRMDVQAFFLFIVIFAGARPHCPQHSPFVPKHCVGVVIRTANLGCACTPSCTV